MPEQVREVEKTAVRDAEPVEPTKKTTTKYTETEIGEAPDPSTTARVVWYITGTLLILLAFRFVLSFLGANRENGFADLIYSVTYPFVAPFFGLFGYNVEYGVARFEIETLVAMAVYALVAYGLVKMIRIARKEA